MNCVLCDRVDLHGHALEDWKRRDSMTGTVQTCEHVRQGAPVALTSRIPANVPGRDGHAFAEPITVQLCSNCVAAGTGGGAATVKGGYSLGAQQRYFGSKVDE